MSRRTCTQAFLCLPESLFHKPLPSVSEFLVGNIGGHRETVESVVKGMPELKQKAWAQSTLAELCESFDRVNGDRKRGEILLTTPRAPLLTST